MTELHNKPDSYKLGSDDLEARPTTPSSGPVTAPLQELQEGGRNGWLAVMGCWSMMFITYGYINAFGVYEAYYLAGPLKDVSPSSIAWIGSIQVALVLSSGLISGPATDRYGPRVILWPASVVYIIALMLTSLCKTYYQFLLAQGILGGLCSGLIYTPAVTVLGQYFRKKRPQVMGIASSGSSLGGVLVPIIVDRLLHHTNVGFEWTQRIVGFIVLLLASIMCLTIRQGAPSRVGTYFLLEAFTRPIFTLQVAGLFLQLLGLFFPFFYLPTYAQLHGTSPDLAWYLIAILNAGSLFGRLIAGITALRLGQFNTLIVSCSICNVLILSWLRITSTSSLIAFSALYGFFSGAVIGLTPATVVHTAPSPDKIGTYLGMCFGILGLAGLTGTPITGAMIRQRDGFAHAIIFSGVVGLAGTVLVVGARICHSRNGQKDSLFV